MITGIEKLSDGDSLNHFYEKISDCKFNIDLKSVEGQFVTLKISLKYKIKQVRSHDYRWVSPREGWSSSLYSPMLVRMDNGVYVQPNRASGVWEVRGKDPDTIYWHFNCSSAGPIAEYHGNSNLREITASFLKEVDIGYISILCSNRCGIELSRSRIPFSAVACFTDHCDYDTLENLELQRRFFRKHDIKVTKGFFLNHYSKREDNASWQEHSSELLKWIGDGHEVAYHSLSQSIRSNGDGIEGFFDFDPPVEGISTWIDHGYQPYNMSLYRNSGISDDKYFSNLYEKGIRNVWNYVDSGTATHGVINQLNSSHFSIGRYWDGIRGFGLKRALPMFIKNLFFHHIGTGLGMKTYAELVRRGRNAFGEKRLMGVIFLFREILKVIPLLIRILLLWSFESKRVYSLAKYTPTVFPHQVNQNQFQVFQTLEMVDFGSGLSRDNIDLLVKECGLVIAHTYFAVPLTYHHGRLFQDDGSVSDLIDSNFKYLSDSISQGKVWNPVLEELIEHLLAYRAVRLDCDSDGMISVVGETKVSYREVE